MFSIIRAWKSTPGMNIPLWAWIFHSRHEFSTLGMNILLKTWIFHSGHEYSTLHKGQVEMLKSVYLSCFTTLCNVQDQIFRMCLALLINIYSCKSITLNWSLNNEGTSAIITIILLYLQVRTSARQSVRSKHVHDTSTKGKIYPHVCHNNCSK